MTEVLFYIIIIIYLSILSLSVFVDIQFSPFLYFSSSFSEIVLASSLLFNGLSTFVGYLMPKLSF